MTKNKKFEELRVLLADNPIEGLAINMRCLDHTINCMNNNNNNNLLYPKQDIIAI